MVKLWTFMEQNNTMLYLLRVQGKFPKSQHLTWYSRCTYEGLNYTRIIKTNTPHKRPLSHMRISVLQSVFLLLFFTFSCPKEGFCWAFTLFNKILLLYIHPATPVHTWDLPRTNHSLIVTETQQLISPLFFLECWWRARKEIPYSL